MWGEILAIGGILWWIFSSFTDVVEDPDDYEMTPALIEAARNRMDEVRERHPHLWDANAILRRKWEAMGKDRHSDERCRHDPFPLL
jgi:hypothetical protein